MALNIKQMLLTPNRYSRPQKQLQSVKAVVVHWLANPNTTGIANREYFENKKYGKEDPSSAHYIIGLEGEIIQCIPDNEVAYAVGSKTYTQRSLNELSSRNPNYCTISIECCHTDWDGTMTQSTYNSLLELCIHLCKIHNLDPVKDLWTHKEVVGWKDCHRWFVNNPNEWMKFKAMVALAINPITVNNTNGIITVISDTLNVRTTPAISNYNILGELKLGSSYQVNGITTNGYYRVTYNGIPAYISARPEYSTFKQLSDNTEVLITMEDLNLIKQQLKIPDSSWAVPQIQKAKENGLINSDHDPNELVTFGVLMTVINNLYDHFNNGK